MNIQTLEGVRKRFVVRLADSEGVAMDATLYEFGGGAECAEGLAADMEVVEVSRECAVLDLQPLTPGPVKGWKGERELWHYQLRATERATSRLFVVLDGEASVAEWRGASESDGAETLLESVQASVVVDGEVVHVDATLENALPGEPGEQGPQGEKGDKGDKGEAFTYEDLTPEQRAELVEPLVLVEATMQPAGTMLDNFDAYGFACVAKMSGTVSGLAIECRSSGTAQPANTPIYVKIWRGNSVVLARSTNACQHAVGATLLYEFEPFSVSAGDELRVTFHEEAGLATSAWQMGRSCCMRVVQLTSGESGGMLNSGGGFSNTAWVAKYAWQMQVERFAPAGHVYDRTVHLTATEREGLGELLARKDELLALLNA